MHFFLLGICGTLMSALALLLREQGHRVSGCDKSALPPVSDMLAREGIRCDIGYDAQALPAADCYVIGNAISRGNPMAERILREKLPYKSAAQLVRERLLQGRQVIAVAGTHGKSTITALTASMLEEAGLQPGWLVGGLPMSGMPPARTGTGPVVIEADEYDTAFFDKSAKFLHYPPDLLLINNLEFDHADIYADIEAIRWQFHCLLRTMPDSAQVLVPADNASVDELLSMGCWSALDRFHSDNGERTDAAWTLQSDEALVIRHKGEIIARVNDWPLPGAHNRHNLLAAFALAVHAGADPAAAVRAAESFKGLKRRFELLLEVGGVRLYDDFAHHPTAIAANLEAIAEQMAAVQETGAEGGRLLAAIDLASNSMAGGHHLAALGEAAQRADRIFWHGQLAEAAAKSCGGEGYTDGAALLERLLDEVRAGDWIILFSNGHFGGLRTQLPDMLERRLSK